MLKGLEKDADSSAASLGKVAENVTAFEHAEHLGAFSALMPQAKWISLMQNRDMRNSDQNPLDIHRRFAALERRITKLEAGLQEVDRVVDSEGWIGEAFDLLERELTGVKQDVKSIDRKIDAILQKPVR